MLGSRASGEARRGLASPHTHAAPRKRVHDQPLARLQCPRARAGPLPISAARCCVRLALRLQRRRVSRILKKAGAKLLYIRVYTNVMAIGVCKTQSDVSAI